MNKSGYQEPPEPAKEGTNLTGLIINHLSQAHDIVGMRPHNGRYTPMVIYPVHSFPTCCGCFKCCCVSIPSGFSAIVQRLGGDVTGDEEDGTFKPGMHWLWPCVHKVGTLVSKQLVVFDTPVKGCTTRDSIKVNVDVLVVFEVKNARDFIYNCGGPEKFDDLLRQKQEELLRVKVLDLPVQSVYDLQGQDTEDLITELNAKHESFGVYYHNFTVKGVTVPDEMAKEWEEIPLFESKTVCERMKKSFDILKQANEEAQKKLKDECDNARMAKYEEAEVTKNRAIKETSDVVAQTTRDIAELEASRQVEEQKVLTDSELEVSKVRSQIMALEREMKSKTQADCARTLAEAEAYAKAQATEAKIDVAGKIANGKKALSEAEGLAASALAARRQFEADLSRMDILEKMIARPDMRIATSQENTIGLSQDNQIVTQVAQQGLEAMRAKLAEVTATSLAKLQAAPAQAAMKR